jgi:EAL domain-containing protein (putative c-di-GMP-specific phosphodiesterase class I)
MKAVAEGVETQEQLDFLLERGCDEFQGFHICRPLPADEIENFLNQSCKTDQ